MSSTPAQSAPKHAWRFFRAGGFDQVRLDSGADLMALDQLDQKLWVALSCPTRGLEFDPRTLDLIDTDRDGHIRVPEVIAAVKWAGSVLKTADTLVDAGDSLLLDAINDGVPEGRRLLLSARQILANLGKAGATAITVDDTTDTARIFAQTNFNGDGIIPADAAEDPTVRSVIADIIACAGSVPDRSGKPGIGLAQVDAFFAEAQAHADWWAKAESQADGVLPLGDATPAAAAAVAKVRAKIDDYFARCRLAEFDTRAQAALNRQESEYLQIAAKDLTIGSLEIAALPLARIEAGKPLPLAEALNPAWAGPMAEFRRLAAAPLLGDKAELTEAGWAALLAKLAPYEAWAGGKAGASVEKLGLNRIREVLGNRSREAIAALIAKDQALEQESTSIDAVDKLVRFNRDLYRLLNNFVSFRDFYSRKDKALFQAGTLYLDQRSCDLCVRVDDMGKHAAMAHLSRSYLAYCDLSRASTGQKMTIAAALTAGDSDNLMVGRNGLFYDRRGNDWDATVVKIVDHPISIGQAFLAPYKRLLRWVEEQVAKRAAAADAAAHQQLTTTAGGVAGAAQTGKPGPAPKLDIGVVAALGVAVGGITAALGVMLQAFFGLGMWMPLGLIALLLLISGPSMVIAWLKLRQRNLGPILDANGWAVNARARINIAFGRSLTSTAKLPAGSSRDLSDPYADRSIAGPSFAAVVVLLLATSGLWYFGAVERVLPGKLPKSGWVKKHATTQPAAAPAPSAAQPGK